MVPRARGIDINFRFREASGSENNLEHNTLLGTMYVRSVILCGVGAQTVRESFSAPIIAYLLDEKSVKKKYKKNYPY
jgi:hypothetical protein